MQLVDDTGFDPFDAGVIADSWRQQPGTPPAYCTELGLEDLARLLPRPRKTRRRSLVTASSSTSAPSRRCRRWTKRSPSTAQHTTSNYQTANIVGLLAGWAVIITTFV